MPKYIISLLTAAVIVASSIILSADTERSVSQYTFVVANAPKDTFSSNGRPTMSVGS
jgi:hypothetical protein